MVLNRKNLFKELMDKFFERFLDVEAIVVSDVEGLVIAGDKRRDIDSDIEIVSVLTTLINPVLERIRNEFAFKKFGTGSFDTEEHRLLFISIDEERVLSLVFNSMASIEKTSPYAFYLAEKIAQILYAKDDDLIQIAIPDFEEELVRHEKLKESICRSDLDECGSYAFKFVIVGDNEVGKTSLIRRFVEQKFSADYRATIGLNILSHTFDFEGNQINCTFWDLGAQAFFKRFRKIYYTGAEAAFIVFDLTSLTSFENVKNWYAEIVELIEENDIPVVLVGNKNDLVDGRVVQASSGETLAMTITDHGLNYLETSAKTGENVKEAFELIAYHYISKSKQKERDIIKSELYRALTLTLKELVILELTFINENLSWNPGFQTIVDIDGLGEYSKIKDSYEEKLYAYKSGLILSCFTYDKFNLSNSDGVFIVFDARDKDHIEPKWRDTLVTFPMKN